MQPTAALTSDNKALSLSLFSAAELGAPHGTGTENMCKASVRSRGGGGAARAVFQGAGCVPGKASEHLLPLKVWGRVGGGGGETLLFPLPRGEVEGPPRGSKGGLEGAGCRVRPGRISALYFTFSSLSFLLCENGRRLSSVSLLWGLNTNLFKCLVSAEYLHEWSLSFGFCRLCSRAFWVQPGAAAMWVPVSWPEWRGSRPDLFVSWAGHFLEI